MRTTTLLAPLVLLISCLQPLTAAESPILLPADDASHPGSANLPEWWYYNGHLTTKASDGIAAKQLGFELVFFQYELWGLPVRAIQLAITDISAKTFKHFTWMLPGEYTRVSKGFDLSIPTGPNAKGGNGIDHLHAALPDGTALDLDLQLLKRPTTWMGTGVIVPTDPTTGTELGRQYYYSRTRIQAQGTFTSGGVARKLGGLTWFDHEWGNLARVGWNWYSIQLDNGQEIMAYDMFEKPGQPSAFTGAEIVGTCFDCGNLIVGPKDFAMPVSGAWKSPHTGIVYPNSFGFEIPSADTKLILTPVMADQEVSSAFLPTYWEGPVSVTGTEYGHPVTGSGYVELAGY